MSDTTRTGIDLDKTREIKGYCPSRADALIDGTYSLDSMSMSFEDACEKLAAFRKSKKKLTLKEDEELEFEIIPDDKKN